MNIRTLIMAAASALCALPLTAAAQASAPAATAPAPRPLKVAPRALSAAEKRDSATAPGEMRPEDPVIPQLSVPLGKAPSSTADAGSGGQRPRPAGAVNGVDDSVARCKAEQNRTARAECLDRLAHAGRNR